MIAYADTGFLISLYADDHNSVPARALTGNRPVFVLTPFGETEFLHVLQLRVFRKEWTYREASAVRDIFLVHQRAGLFHPEPFSPEIWQTAQTISFRHAAKLGVRTLDLLHVAAVLNLKPDAFYSFDERQRRLAKAEGLDVLPA